MRRAENKRLLALGDERLTGTKYAWLRHPANFSEDAWREFRPLREKRLEDGAGVGVEGNGDAAVRLSSRIGGASFLRAMARLGESQPADADGHRSADVDGSPRKHTHVSETPHYERGQRGVELKDSMGQGPRRAVSAINRTSSTPSTSTVGNSIWLLRPLKTRKSLQVFGTGVTGYFLANQIGANEAWAAGPVEPKNTAKQAIFIFLEGAPSGVDTFDFKEIAGVTPADFNPDTINGIQIPTGLFPNTAQVLDKVAIIRSGLSWALAHNLAQTWFQIGRNPTSPLGAIAPHFGSVVAIEKDPERRPDQLFPTFIALNAGNAPGSGYFPIEYGPFKTIPDANGLASTVHEAGQVRFDKRWDLLQTLDAPLRGTDSPLGSAVAGMSDFYQSARGLMFNPVVDEAFSFTTEESLAYGDTNFGDACLMAKKIVAADQGTRFLQITQRGWDHHQGIYDRNEVNGRQVGQNIYAQTAEFRPGLCCSFDGP